MREIKFRAKAKDSKQWVYGFYYEQPAPIHCFGKQDEPTGYIITKKPYTLTDWDMPIPMVAIEVDRNTLGQSTSYRDRTEKRIYEGDILKKENCWTIVIEHCKNSFKVRDLDEIRYINKVCDYYLDDFDIESWEIIGNIHENQELLEVEE